MEDDDMNEMGEMLATQVFLEKSEAKAALFHHQTKSLHEINQLPFSLGRLGDLVTYDSNRDPDKQLCSRIHAIIKERENVFELHSNGAHGTAILRQGVTINIPVGQHDTLKDGDGIKLGSLNETGYRSFIYTFSLKNNLIPRDLKCQICNDFFEFSTGEQLFYKRKGFKDPIRCSSCRENKKRNRDDNGKGTHQEIGVWENGKSNTKLR
jgi:hypothetical protein